MLDITIQLDISVRLTLQVTSLLSSLLLSSLWIHSHHFFLVLELPQKFSPHLIFTTFIAHKNKSEDAEGSNYLLLWTWIISDAMKHQACTILHSCTSFYCHRLLLVALNVLKTFAFCFMFQVDSARYKHAGAG